MKVSPAILIHVLYTFKSPLNSFLFRLAWVDMGNNFILSAEVGAKPLSPKY